MLDVEVTNYDAVNSGYDGVFGDYVSYIKEMVSDALNQFMAVSTASSPAGGPSQAYFDCAYSSKDTSNTFSQACPINWRKMSGFGKYTITYTLRDSDGFWAALAKKYSIDKSWVVFGKTTVESCSNSRGPCVAAEVINVGIPQVAPGFTPTNPKDATQIDSMQDTILVRQMDIATGTWNNGTHDVVQVLSMPVFMISQALQAMGSVKEIGKKEKKEKKIALIVEILGIVFAFIPFIDEVTVPAFGFIDGAFEIVAAAGNVVLAIEGIVTDPKSAPMDILSALTLGKSKTTNDFAGLAAAKRAIRLVEYWGRSQGI